jgi:hypothetical protein
VQKKSTKIRLLTTPTRTNDSGVTAANAGVGINFQKNRLDHGCAPHSGSARRKGHGFRNEIMSLTEVGG